MADAGGPAPDRVGIGWRGELAAGIMANLDRIDIVEVIADDYLRAPRHRRRALRTLASQVPVTLHGVAMGLASTAPADARRMESMAHLVEYVRPQFWSEHMAFVRAGGIEIGHLAAPPRTERNIEAAIANVERSARIVGATPWLENIATLVEPPASALDEATWLTGIVIGSGSRMLLDLHNLYANAVNFGRDPAAELLRLPLDRIGAIHLSGGHWILEPGNPGRQRLLDDHVHDVPDQVFALLTLVARHAAQPMTVIIERDGAYPAFSTLLAQLDTARSALRAGRMVLA